MTGAERGFLLLTSHLGDSERHPLTSAQFRTLAQRSRAMGKPVADTELELADLVNLGYGREMAERILLLLEEQDVLEHYLRRGARSGCQPLTWVSEGYPSVVRQRLGDEATGCLWIKGDIALLDMPMVALVGSRDILPENRAFARAVGHQAAQQGFTLVSGNARGADRTAQQSCLAAGGKVICVVADKLEQCEPCENILYISEDVFDGAFSAQRALSRNRIIHCLGSRVFVAQCTHGHGGTWDGTTKNLRQEWSSVYCFRDGTNAMNALEQMGAEQIELGDLHNIRALSPRYFGLFDQ
ncbi:MAG: DNA-processing protein DprA [Ruminococcaceae bacterium]|nr:DNA-processing protein DprA [Oscillospiraceae bacterium]MBQ3215451.1 DNA-protecting protein DprA [Oscillospiraceae bacterium]